MRALLAAVALAALMTGCAQLNSVVTKVQMFTLADVTQAAAMAKAASDTQGEACWVALEPIVSLAPNGVVSSYELIRAGQSLANGTCAPVFAGLAMQIGQTFAPVLAAPLVGIPLGL